MSSLLINPSGGMFGICCLNRTQVYPEERCAHPQTYLIKISKELQQGPPISQSIIGSNIFKIMCHDIKLNKKNIIRYYPIMTSML